MASLAAVGGGFQRDPFVRLGIAAAFRESLLRSFVVAAIKGKLDDAGGFDAAPNVDRQRRAGRGQVGADVAHGDRLLQAWARRSRW